MGVVNYLASQAPADISKKRVEFPCFQRQL
jgi:hypothetical protein